MLIVAHRGSPSRELSENTLDALHAGLIQGADGVEFDLRVSKDDELVIVHDANLHRIAGDAHKVTELTLDELQAIPLRNGGRIVSLNDVTAALHAPFILDIEIKTRDATESLIRKLKTSQQLRERSIVSSFQAKSLARVRKECPDVRILLLIPRWPLPLRRAAMWQRIQALAPWGVGFELSVLNPRRVKFLRALGVHVAGWDRRGSARELRRAALLNIDLAIVKQPGKLKELVEAKE